MSKYTIDWIKQSKTSTGKIKADATLSDENGNTTENVTIWGDFPDFAALMSGKEVNGSIFVSHKGTFTNRTLYPDKKPAAMGAGYKRSANNIKAAMTEKAQNIERAQERTTTSVKTSGTSRDATLMTTTIYGDVATMYPDVTAREEFMRKKWLAWKAWLVDNFGDNEPPFKN